MAELSCNIRIVLLGGGGVGKTAILKRFLFNTFVEKYRPTVEDLFFKEFNHGTVLLKVDFLDTAGDMQFPAMRRLSITNAQAFLLVYSISDPNSFDIVKTCFEEIREVRSDFQEIPVIFAGNKSDVGLEERYVLKEDVSEWVYCELPKLRTKVIECSAKSNINIREIFKTFLQLAKIPAPSHPDDSALLRRRSSAHASVSKSRSPNLLSPLSTSPVLFEESDTSSSPTATSSKLKPRTRSLIRRTSKKVNKVKDPNSDPGSEDCTVS